GGLAHSHGYNPFGPPLGGDSRGFTGFYHQFRRPLHAGFAHQFRTPHGGDGPRFMRNVFHVLRAEATSFQPLVGPEEQVEAATPLDDFPPPEEQVETATPLDDFPPPEEQVETATPLDDFPPLNISNH
ncbi:hypothetical protein Tco_1325905, partial [Tanacetum coccineum]